MNGGKLTYYPSSRVGERIEDLGGDPASYRPIALTSCVATVNGENT